MRLRKILCPIDFSQGASNAMRTAIRIANENGAELVLAHVFSLPIGLAMGEPMLPADVVTTLADDARRGIDMALEEATKLGAKRVSAVSHTGVAWVELVDMLEKDATFDLVVMGTHGRTGLSRVLLGSVTEKVVRHAPCSVLTMRPDATPTQFTKILCATDFSASAQVATDLAANMRAQSITLLHTIEVVMPYGGEPFPTAYIQDLEERTTDDLQAAATVLRKLAEVPVETAVRHGRAAPEIIELLDEDRNFDLVVIGSHGRTGIKRALLGSVAEAVVRHARCPVLVARRRV